MFGFCVGYRALPNFRSKEAKAMFYHGWNAYEQFAYPSDELRPLTCTGMDRDPLNPLNIGRNDVLGNYSLTLVDSLDMFAILGDQEKFEKYVETVSQISFNISSTVQVFETTIRGLGGLLTGHLYASVPRLGCAIEGYNGELLSLAYDLGLRLLPAFNTTTGIPSPRVNLRYGIDPAVSGITETCTSGAGSLLLEFGLLSRLTGDKRFDQVARRAFFALYMRRTDLDLVAMSIDSQTGQWQAPITGNGASIDSFYEYALKYSILFGDDDFMAVFNRLYRALKANSFDGWSFRNIHYEKAYLMTSWIDSLAAFFTGLMVLVGDIESAVYNHLTYYKIWTTFAGLPERWSFTSRYESKYGYEDPVNLEWYPLRPEFIESNYYLYQATKDPFFLQIGHNVMTDLQRYNKVPCGYAGTQDVRTGQLSNRMESFFLSETTKYLYLLFKRDHPLNKDFSNWVFSTEAHPMWYDEDILEYAGHARFEMDMEIEDSEFEQPKSKPAVKLNIIGKILSHLGVFIGRLLRALDDMLLSPEMVQYMEDLHHSSHANRSRSERLSMPRFLYDQQCEIPPQMWQESSIPGFYSNLGSWHLLYHLDSAYNFAQPPHLLPSRSIENSPFYQRYVDPSATCLAPYTRSTQPNEEVVDILMSIPKGGRKGTVLWRHSGGEVETTSLQGMRLKLRKGEQFTVTMVNGIRVEGMLWVRELSSMNKNSDLSMEVKEDQVWLSGIPVRNLRVIGK